MKTAHALSVIPPGLRDPLIAEYRSIIQNYLEHRWSPSELSGGRFCEITYSILNGYANNKFPNTPSKPSNFVAACRDLEKHSQVSRSFQILIPRALPALYEVRNNRGVGHVGGDVNPNHMDATFVVAICNWIMAELVRVFHNLDTAQAQALVDSLAERTIPVVWEGENVKRVLDTSLSLRQQILVLAGISATPVAVGDLVHWTEYRNKAYFNKLLMAMHKERLIEFSKKEGTVSLLPRGTKQLSLLATSKSI
jgi:hypothetical protein